MKYFVISIHPSESYVTEQPTLEEAVCFLDSIGGWEDGRRFIAVPMIRREVYSRPAGGWEVGTEVKLTMELRHPLPEGGVTIIPPGTAGRVTYHLEDGRVGVEFPPYRGLHTFASPGLMMAQIES